MKTAADVQNRLKSELDQWFIKQCRDPFTDYHLYYMKATPEHDGGISFCKEAPQNTDVRLGSKIPVCKGSTVQQNFNMFLPIVNQLPILTV